MVKIIPISSIEDLQNMGKTGYYKLTKNLNCDGFTFEMIPEFHGTLDGAGHTVKNLKIHQGVALIGRCRNVTIKNIQFDSLYVDGHDYCAGITRDLFGKCKFENVIIKNSMITGSFYVGGFVGFVLWSSAVKCSNCKVVNSKITATSNYVGGFIGYVDSSSSFSASGCVVDGVLVESESNCVGGFVGYSIESSTITCSNCKFVNSKVSAGIDNAGGFVGEIYRSSNFSASGCVVDGALVESTGSNCVGGFVGCVNPLSVVKCSNCKFVNSKVFAGDYVGGFVGFGYDSSITFSECDVSNSNVIARRFEVGGFVGEVHSSSVIVNSVVENTKIEGSNNVGGFVGFVVNSLSEVVSVRDSVISGCKVNAKKDTAGSIIGHDYLKTSVISNVSVLNTTVTLNKKHVTNKVGNINLENTVRGYTHRVPSRKPTTRKTATRKPTTRKTVTTRKPSIRKTCKTKRMVGKVNVNYKKML